MLPAEGEALVVRGVAAGLDHLAYPFLSPISAFIQSIGHREDDRRVLLGGDLDERLQVAQVQRDRLRVERARRLGQLLARLELARGVDDLGPLLALRLGLLRHRPLHLLRQVHGLHRHLGDLHAPGVGVQVDDLLQPQRQPLALGEQLVEVGLAEDAAQRRLRLLARGVEEVLDGDHRLQRVHHPEVDDRVHLHGDVVAGDHVLGRHVEDDRAQAHPHHAVDGPGHDDEPGALGLRQHLAEPEDDAALVLVQDLDRQQQPEHDGAEDEDHR